MRHLIGLVFILLLTGCSSYPQAVPPAPERGEAKIHRAFVINHGWHTGVIIAAEPVAARLSFVREQLGAAAFYEFGWGDKAFYTAQTVTMGLALRAALWPSDSVVHVAPLQRAPDRHYSEERLVRIALSSAQMHSLVLFLQRSFHYDDAQQVVAHGRGYLPGSWFFAGAGQYNLTNTCNTWTAKALKSAGLEIEPSDIITADALMNALAQALNQPDPASSRNAPQH